jgi:acetyltransferase-like isoleucine patch superfamily enzyme
MIHETAIVEEGAQIGPGTRVWHFSHIMPEARIGRGCIVGQNCYVDGIVGDFCKIQNNVSVYKGVWLAEYVFAGPSVVFTNDLFPRARDVSWSVTPTYVAYGASIGANATILCGVRIGQHAMIGCGSVVLTNVPDYAIVAGNPGKIIGYVDPHSVEPTKTVKPRAQLLLDL